MLKMNKMWLKHHMLAVKMGSNWPPLLHRCWPGSSSFSFCPTWRWSLGWSCATRATAPWCGVGPWCSWAPCWERWPCFRWSACTASSRQETHATQNVPEWETAGWYRTGFKSFLGRYSTEEASLMFFFIIKVYLNCNIWMWICLLFCINDHAASHRIKTMNLLVTVINDEITFIVKTTCLFLLKV